MSWKIGVSPSESRIQIAIATRRREMMKGRRQAHAGQRDDEGVLPADLVTEPAEDERPQGPDQEADREDRHRAEEGGHRVALLEELDGEDRGQAPEDVEVVPLDDVAHRRGDDDATELLEWNFRRPHRSPLCSTGSRPLSRGYHTESARSLSTLRNPTTL